MAGEVVDAGGHESGVGSFGHHPDQRFGPAVTHDESSVVAEALEPAFGQGDPALDGVQGDAVADGQDPPAACN